MPDRILSTGALVIAAMVGAFGCECNGVQPFCNAPPALSDSATAVFVGVVKDIYPAETRADYRLALRTAAGVQRGKELALDDLKRGLLNLWRGYLSQSEEAKIRSAASARDLDPLEMGTPFLGMPRLVTLEVVEPFSNSDAGEFKVSTGIGEGDCGVNFHKGGTFLVVAHKYGSAGRWSTDVCSRTQPVDDAGNDLKALRASKNSRPLKPFISGALSDWTDRGRGHGAERQTLANVKVLLRSAGVKKEVMTDSGGRFSFDNLSHQTYRVDFDLPGWSFAFWTQTMRDVDLTKAFCAERFLSVEELRPAQRPGFY